MPGIPLPPTPEGTHNDVHRERLHPADGAAALERPAAAKAAGFDAVEFWWPFQTSVPTDAEVAGFVNAISDAGVQLTGLNFYAGDMPGGDRGLVSWPARSTEFLDNVDVVVGIGERLGCKAFNALYGTASTADPRGAGRAWRREPRAGGRRSRPHRRHGAAGARLRRPSTRSEDPATPSTSSPGSRRNRRRQHQAAGRLLPPGGQRRRRRRRDREPRQGLRPHPDRRQPRPRGARNREAPARRMDRPRPRTRLRRLRRPRVQGTGGDPFAGPSASAR